jgi:hypothetical protein
MVHSSASGWLDNGTEINGGFGRERPESAAVIGVCALLK